jgi:hypothetical protein
VSHTSGCVLQDDDDEEEEEDSPAAASQDLDARMFDKYGPSSWEYFEMLFRDAVLTNANAQVLASPRTLCPFPMVA